MGKNLKQIEGIQKQLNECAVNAYDWGYKQGQKDMEQDTMAILENGKMMGRVEAWECCRKLFATMPEKDIEQAFYAEWHNGGFNALMNLDVTDAIRRIEEYEKKKKDDEIKVGDEVDHDGLKCVVVKVWQDCICTISQVGTTPSYTDKSVLKKTGRHFDAIAEILQQLNRIGENNDTQS